MTAMVPLETALQQMLESVAPLAPQSISVMDADGCVLAEDCLARRTQPPFNVSAMDGYALQDAPVPGSDLSVIGESAAGNSFDGTVGPGEAVRIFTGAQVPADAGHIVIQEDVDRVDDIITLGADAGGKNHIRPAGGDFTEGNRLVAKGTLLTPQGLMLAASANHADLVVIPKPSIHIIMNGDELVWPGDDAPRDAIIASNGFALQALAKRLGSGSVEVDLLPDSLEALTEALQTSQADIILTVGGASVGDHDLVRPALLSANFSVDVPKVALRPGKPTLFGRRAMVGRDQLVLGLPGNPVSAFVSALIFLRPLIASLAGRPMPDPLPLDDAVLSGDVPANGPRAHFMRAQRDENGHYGPVVSQDSSLMKLLASSHGLIYRPVDAPAAKTGDACRILSLPT